MTHVEKINYYYYQWSRYSKSFSREWIVFFLIKSGICLNVFTIQLSQFLIDKRTAPNVNHNIFESFLRRENSSTNEIVSFDEPSLVENEQNYSLLLLVLLLLSCQFNNPPLRRWKKTQHQPRKALLIFIIIIVEDTSVPLSASTSNDEIKKSSLLLLFFLLLKKTHHHHLLCTIRWSVVWLLIYIYTYNHPYTIVIFLLHLIYLWHS